MFAGPLSTLNPAIYIGMAWHTYSIVLRFNIETMHYQRKFKFPFVLIFLRVDDTFVCMFDDLSYFKLWLSGLTYQKVYNIGLKRYRGRWGRGDQSVRRILYSLQTFHKKTTQNHCMIIFLKFSKSKTTFSSVIMAKKTIYFGEFKIIFVTLFKNRCSDSQKTEENMKTTIRFKL